MNEFHYLIEQSRLHILTPPLCVGLLGGMPISHEAEKSTHSNCSVGWVGTCQVLSGAPIVLQRYAI